ncbi:hypothetical protein PAAG_04056 [Paracoccidioides lutzii Pb01]|uniref:Uncharacterized protein n=1 Tax=Paracoccidioides lutzii (strain ATCC MYA-826 / Pb01) TaxID=502779 RepID=C1GZW2_PARBA|nr:hypothetical protein PAAG_04056 [Paracoccidioides lutzii Pb01]EEH33003.2 hypothetical protein PAAG_04056 [Paracoccidioides lutzii Pb01]
MPGQKRGRFESSSSCRNGCPAWASTQTLLATSDYASKFLDDDGDLKGGFEIPPVSLEGIEKNLQGSNKKLFLQFMQNTLHWAPAARSTEKSHDFRSTKDHIFRQETS